MKIGQEVLVFNHLEWSDNGGDCRKPGCNNSCFYKPAIITAIYRTKYNEEVADIKWIYNGKISRGHFTNAIENRL